MRATRCGFLIWAACFAIASSGSSHALLADDLDPARHATAAMLPVTPDNSMATGLALGIYSSGISDAANRKLASYETDASGQWILPTVTVNAETNHIPLVLKTPQGLIRIRLSVLVNGLSPEQATEKMLDQVITRAGTEIAVETKTEPKTEETSEAAKEPSAPSLEATQSNELPDADEATVTAAEYSRDSVLTKLERLVRATGAEAADREELRWMLDQWRPGPLWLIARDSVSPPRQLTEPLVAWMDSDRDGVVQKSEWQNLSQRLRALDSNRDRIVRVNELEENSAKIVAKTRSAAPRLDWNLAWDSQAPTHRNTKDTDFPNTDPHDTGLHDTQWIDTVDIVVHVRSPDVVNQVASMVDGILNTQFEKNLGSQMAVRAGNGSVVSIPGGVQTTFRTDIKNDSLTPEQTPDTRKTKAPLPVIGLTVHGYVNQSLTSVASCQFSIAARIADHPVWDLLDSNADGRLVEVEQRAAANLIANLDCNQDGILSPEEWPLAFQLVVCQGSDATEQLKSTTPRSIAMPNKVVTPVPDWFAGMDSNQDGSLSRDEFLGSTKQFNDYDKNGDGLMTSSETTLPK